MTYVVACDHLSIVHIDQIPLSPPSIGMVATGSSVLVTTGPATCYFNNFTLWLVLPGYFLSLAWFGNASLFKNHWLIGDENFRDVLALIRKEAIDCVTSLFSGEYLFSLVIDTLSRESSPTRRLAHLVVRTKDNRVGNSFSQLATIVASSTVPTTPSDCDRVQLAPSAATPLHFSPKQAHLKHIIRFFQFGGRK